MSDTETSQNLGNRSGALRELVAGSAGGVFQVLTGQPFDTIKVRLQIQDSTGAKYKGVTDCVRSLIADEGVLALYKGVLAPLVGVGTCVSAQFGGFGFAKDVFRNINASNGFKNPDQFTPSQLFLSGSFSGLVSSFVTCPVEHVRTRLQIQKESPVNGSSTAIYKGPTDSLCKIYKQYGIAGVFKGQAVTTARECLGLGLYFTSYEYVIAYDMKRKNITSRYNLSTLTQAAAGIIAGQIYWAALYPIDVLKSRIQTDQFEKSKRLYKSFFDCLSKSIRIGGITSLYRGFWVCFIRAAPANAVCFVAYENTMKLMSENRS